MLTDNDMELYDILEKRGYNKTVTKIIDIARIEYHFRCAIEDQARFNYRYISQSG